MSEDLGDKFYEEENKRIDEEREQKKAEEAPVSAEEAKPTEKKEHKKGWKRPDVSARMTEAHQKIKEAREVEPQEQEQAQGEAQEQKRTEGQDETRHPAETEPKPKPILKEGEPSSLSDDELEDLIDPDRTLRHIEKGQNFLFPSPSENIDLKTILSPEDVENVTVIETAADWFPKDLGWVKQHSEHFKRNCVSTEGIGREQGLELQTTAKAMERLRQVATPATQGQPQEKAEGAPMPKKKKRSFLSRILGT